MSEYLFQSQTESHSNNTVAYDSNFPQPHLTSVLFNAKPDQGFSAAQARSSFGNGGRMGLGQAGQKMRGLDTR